MTTNKIPRIYIDSCYYIDVVKGRHNVPTERDAHLAYVEGLLLASLDGHIEVWASTLVISECLSIDPNNGTVTESVQKTFQEILTSGSVVKLSAVDYFVAEQARDLRWVHDIRCGRGADSIHVATALQLGCVEFLSSNRSKGPLQGDSPKKLSELGLRVIQAPDTTCLPKGYEPPPLFVGH